MTGYNASDTSVGDSGISARTTYTARGWNALTSWDDDKYTYSQMQLYLGTNPISLLEVVSLLNINNISSYMFTYNDQARPPKYNPIMNLGVINTSAIMWNIDLETGQNKKYFNCLLINKVFTFKFNYFIIIFNYDYKYWTKN